MTMRVRSLSRRLCREIVLSPLVFQNKGVDDPSHPDPRHRTRFWWYVVLQRNSHVKDNLTRQSPWKY